MAYSAQLKLAYGLIVVSLFMPVLSYVLPGENPFGLIAKVWSEPDSQIKGEVLTVATTNFRLAETYVNPQMTWEIPITEGALSLLILSMFFLYSLVRLFYNSYQTNKIVREAFLIKQLGRVKIWLHQDIVAPFSYYNLRANVVLPQDSLEDRKKLRIVVAHEIQHHRQKDTLWVYLLESLKLLIAINPIAKKLVYQIMELQELACDEALVGHGRFSPHQYGRCLYDYAEKQLLKLQCPIGAIGMAAETTFLKRRIEIMFQTKKKTSKRTMAACLCLCLLGMSTVAWTFKGAVSDQKITLAQARSMAGKISEDQDIPIVVDKNVLFWLNKAVGSEASRKYMRESLARMEAYKPMIVEKLGNVSFPEELLAVPLVESGYRNDVVSTAKAAGIWQFIASTASKCGLSVNNSNDERFNPNRLTDAAVTYYQKLFAIFQNWHVALTAYNIGERRMMNVISEAGHNNILKLAQEGQLGSEGGAYLPKVLAAMIILKNPHLVE